MTRKGRLIGPICVLLSAVSWSFSGVLSRGIEWNGFSKAGARAVIAVFIYGAYRRSFKIRLTRNTVIGALGVMLTSVLYMVALSYTTSANAIILQYSMPIFVVGIDWLLFHRRPSLVDVIAVILVAAGVLLCCVQNLGGGAFFGDMLSLVSGLTFALVFVVSQLPNTSATDYTYLGILLCVPLTVSVFFDPGVHFTVSDAVSARALFYEWLSVFVMGVLLAFGYLFLAIGMKKTSPVTAAILENLEPVLNPVWVFLFYGENPGLYTVLGAILVLITVTVYSLIPALTEKRAAKSRERRL